MFARTFTALQLLTIRGRVFGNPLFVQSVAKHTDPKNKLTASYLCGPGNVPMMGLTIGQLVQRAADLYGDRLACIFSAQKIRKSFQEMLDEADQVAAGLLSLGLQRGDRIGIWGPNSHEWVLTQWAAARAGLILVNINPAYRVNELRYALNKVEVKALVVAEKFRNQNLISTLSELLPLNEACTQSGERCTVSSSLVPSLQRVVVLSDQSHLNGAIRWKDLMAQSTPALISQVHNLQKRVQFDDPVNIQFTSGTTGSPKGATLSHHNIINHGYLNGFRLGYNEHDDVLCIPLPLYHSFACGALLAATSHGCCVVFPSPTFSSKETIEAVQRERCTILYGAPTMLVDILALPNLKDYDVKSLRMGILGGAPCPLEIAKAAESDLNIECIMIGYGMTETSSSSFLTLRTDSVETRCSTVGYPSDHVEIKIVDPLTGEIVPVNTPGEILSRGYSTMLGYWKDETKTNETITKDRWLRSGDIGVMNENGYGQIVGRMKDMVIRGGENVYPREIEEVLHTHPGVQEAHVIGVPDKRLGEEICAWVRCKTDVTLTELEMKEFCEQRLAYFKVPRYWLFKQSFPVTVTGKVQKFVMKDITVKELGL